MYTLQEIEKAKKAATKEGLSQKPITKCKTLRNQYGVYGFAVPRRLSRLVFLVKDWL